MELTSKQRLANSNQIVSSNHTAGDIVPLLSSCRCDNSHLVRSAWAEHQLYSTTDEMRDLLAYFGEDRALASITAGGTRDWERWLKSGTAREGQYAGRKAGEGLAPNTVRKLVSNAKQFLQDAVEHDLIEKNPFAKLVGTLGSNRERDFFIDRRTASKVLDA